MNSKCGSCGGFMWEISEESPFGSSFKVNFIRCSGCKVPIGVMDYFDTFTKLERIEKEIKKSVSSLQNDVQVIDQNVRRLFQK